nr:glycogen debranching enzyme GlgX [Pseudaminobacter sp.]
ILRDKILIAEPWAIGPGGYQLGNFPTPFLEWNDKYRDDSRRFWRGDSSMVGVLARRLSGSSDVFGGGVSRSVNFITAHDGMTLADLAGYERKHNEANGEQNRDGHGDNLSWNNGVEGETDDPDVGAQRKRDIRALLATLFASRGTIMLTAGDEFGRTQHGNNNAYAQDNLVTWLDWAGRDRSLEDHVAALATMRKAMPVFSEAGLFTGNVPPGREFPDVEWLTETGRKFTGQDWSDPERYRLTMMLGGAQRLAVLINGDRRASVFSLPPRDGFRWTSMVEVLECMEDDALLVPGRSVFFMVEAARDDSPALSGAPQ